MLTYFIFFMIFVGVTIALHQVYSVHYDINFEDEEQRPKQLNSDLKELSVKAREHSETDASQGFIQAVHRIFGHDFDHRIVFAAFSSDSEKRYAEPLLRRKKKIVTNGVVKVLHLPFWKTSPPKKDIRGAMITFIIANSLLALFLGAMSIYTIAYPVSIESLTWVNNELILMALVCLLVMVNYATSKLDVYMHDIYQVGKLYRIAYEGQNRS